MAGGQYNQSMPSSMMNNNNYNGSGMQPQTISQGGNVLNEAGQTRGT